MTTIAEVKAQAILLGGCEAKSPVCPHYPAFLLPTQEAGKAFSEWAKAHSYGFVSVQESGGCGRIVAVSPPQQ